MAKKIKEFELENRLAELRKKWLATADPIMKGIIERQAKALKLASGSLEETIKKAKKIFK